MNNDTPTPRTDAIHQKYITAAFAKQLERELTAMTKQRDRLAEALKPISETSLLGADDSTVRYIFKGLQHNVDAALQSLNQPTETKTK